ncbi:MAG: hypothetical protein KGO96_08930 [Elusimicrobia bacterium]|nr:hypothetical protein [Elusimicrobiota bacterium]MDE2237722.1 hypothetical protein [Elusimicrobiota bacterium]MDE2426014.1 hypothetical protein [Elusimicrobiota bacterium]
MKALPTLLALLACPGLAFGQESLEAIKALPFDATLTAPGRFSPAPRRLAERTAELSLRLPLSSNPRVIHTLLRSVPLGGQRWDLGVSATKGFTRFFLVFSRGSRVLAYQVDHPTHLLGSGLDFDVDGLSVHVRLDADLFYMNSALEITPAGGDLLSYSVKPLMALLQKQSQSFDDGTGQYWLLESADADSSGARPSGSRSYIFYSLGFLRPYVWSLGEAQLPLGQAVPAELWRPLTLTRDPFSLLIQSRASARDSAAASRPAAAGSAAG